MLHHLQQCLQVLAAQGHNGLLCAGLLGRMRRYTLHVDCGNKSAATAAGQQ
jgi:hypothetical protein